MDALQPYLSHLESHRDLRVVGVSASPKAGRGGRAGEGDARVTLRTRGGKVVVQAFELKSHLGHDQVDHLIARMRRGREAALVLAPHIGAGIGAKLARAGINYVDRHGNCHVALGAVYVHVEGRTGRPVAAAEKGLRGPGYQVLFAYLAEPALLDQPLRTVARRAGVSRQPASAVRQRLLEEGHVVETRTRCQWVERRRDDALNLWLRGYEAAVRPSLLWGTYRTKSDPDELEKRMASALRAAGVSEHRWGGTAAGFRLTGHYRGPRTTVHLRAAPPGSLPRELRAMSDPGGNLVLMDAFGEINWEPDRDVVHPLLVYSEMLREGDERAREAAEELFEEIIRPSWGQTA